MTDEQSKLVEDNHSLIYLIIHKMGLSVEENYDLAAIGLCKAAISYKEEKSAFTTWACNCIRNELLLDYRKRNMPKRVLNENLISYDAPYQSSDESEEISLLDSIRSNDSVENEALSRVMYEEVIEQLGTTDSKVLIFFKKGLKQREIAQIMGVSQANISRVKRRVEKIVHCNY